MKKYSNIKKELHQMIESIDDESTLNILMEEVSVYAKGTIGIEDLSAEQLKDLDESITESDNGEVITHDEFIANLDQWRTALHSRKDLITK